MKRCFICFFATICCLGCGQNEEREYLISEIERLKRERNEEQREITQYVTNNLEIELESSIWTFEGLSEDEKGNPVNLDSVMIGNASIITFQINNPSPFALEGLNFSYACSLAFYEGSTFESKKAKFLFSRNIEERGMFGLKVLCNYVPLGISTTKTSLNKALISEKRPYDYFVVEDIQITVASAQSSQIPKKGPVIGK